MTLGVRTFIKEQVAKTKVETEIKKEESKDTPNDARVAALEKKLADMERQQQDSRTMNAIDISIAKSGLPEDWHEDARDKVIAAIATNPNKSLGDIIKTATESIKKKLEKYQPKVDVAKKEEVTKSMGPGTASGKRAGEEAPKVLKKESFRSGDLASSIAKSIKENPIFTNE